MSETGLLMAYAIFTPITRQQRDELDRLKARTSTVTDGAMVKKALAHYIDCVSPEEER